MPAVEKSIVRQNGIRRKREEGKSRGEKKTKERQGEREREER